MIYCQPGTDNGGIHISTRNQYSMRTIVVHSTKYGTSLFFPTKLTSMSARQAKRLLASQQEEVQSVENDELDEQVQPARRSAGFAFLVDDSSSSDDDDDEEEEEAKEEQIQSSHAQEREQEGKQEEEEEEEEEEEADQSAKGAVTSQATANSKAKKRSTKKKNQKKKKKQEAKEAIKDQREIIPHEQDDNALLDALVATANELAMDTQDGSPFMAHDPKQDLLAVQIQFLNADKEMKRIFGVRDRDNAASDVPGRGTRRNNVARRTTKRVMMVTPLDEWPRAPTFVGGGIRWTRATRPEDPGWDRNCHYFEIDWSIAYKKLQEEFEALQRTHDPNVIGLFLQRYPFHVDALLQMSEVFQHHGQMDHASDCIKRCIYLFELAWADNFDVSKGNCRMCYHDGQNDGFFRALFLYMKQVGRRGCLRSAFELAKLLIALDPHGDPMNVLLALDYYALSARQYDFVVQLADTKLQSINRFGTPHHKPGSPSQQEAISPTRALPTWQFSLALATFHLGHVDDAKELLTSALLRFPSVLARLVDKCDIKTSSAPWKAVLDHMVFANGELACKLDSDHDHEIKHLLSIYVARNFSLWKVSEVQALLLQAAQQAIDRQSCGARLETEREVLELPGPLKKYKRAALHDYSDEITTLPPDHPMMRPPELPQELDAEQMAALAEMQDQMQQGNLPADANPLLLFLQTLLPWNRVQQQGGAAPPAPDQ